MGDLHGTDEAGRYTMYQAKEDTMETLLQLLIALRALVACIPGNLGKALVTITKEMASEVDHIEAVCDDLGKEVDYLRLSVTEAKNEAKTEIIRLKEDLRYHRERADRLRRELDDLRRNND